MREGREIKREEKEERNGEEPRGLGEVPGKEGKGGVSVCVYCVYWGGGGALGGKER